MSQRVLPRLMLGLVTSVSVHLPLFAANTAITTPMQTSALAVQHTKTKVANKKTQNTKTAQINHHHTLIHKALAATPKSTTKKTTPTTKAKVVAQKTPILHKKIANAHLKKTTGHKIHSHYDNATVAINPNPQDYVPSKQRDVIRNIANSSANEQDFVANSFDQQINLRLSHYQNSVCANAEAQVGKPYQWGVEDPEAGFDCSGLSQFVYAQEGIQIPRTAASQYQSLAPVKHLQAGDLVFFRTLSRSSEISHVGIYIGNGYFVHSPRSGETIRISRLNDSYWHDHYAGARRVLTRTIVEDNIASLNQKNIDNAS